MLNRGPVLHLIDRADTWRAAQLDIIVQAGPFIVAGNDAVAGQIGENLSQQIEGLLHRPD